MLGRGTWTWCAVIAAVLVLTLAHYAAADEVLPLLARGSANALDSRRDADRLKREYTHHDLTARQDAAEGPIVAWEFQLREGAFADLFTMTEIPREFRAIRLRLRCRGEGFSLAVKIGDASGAEWTVDPAAIAGNGDWRTVDFGRDGFRVASWSQDLNGRLDFPCRYLAVIAFGVKPGPEYEIDLASIQALLPDRPEVRVGLAELPRRASAGAKVDAHVRLTPDRQLLDDTAELVFRLGGVDRFAVPIPLASVPTALAPGKPIDVTFPVEIPLYAHGGGYRVDLRIGQARVAFEGRGLDEGIADMEVTPRVPGHTSARVSVHNGTPTLILNDQPQSAMTYMAYGPSTAVFRDFAQQGVRLFSFSATPTESGYGLARTAWRGPDDYDFSQFDERAMMVLSACPDAFFFPRIYLHAPQWWSDAHPDDLVLQQNPDGTIERFIHAGGKPAPSWVSEAWRKDTARGIERLVAHIEASPYADRVIGYHIASGTTEEWMMWGANENQWVDYSPANARAFRAWLQRRYKTDDGLRTAWGDPKVTLATAAIPSRADRERSLLGWLRDPARERGVIDFYEYNSWLVADTIRYFAAETKRIAGRDKIVGVFYGYLLQLIAEQRMQNAGHLALADVLASPDVDFLTSPTSYMFRDPTSGTSHFMSLFDSVKLHGKLWFDENDIRTSLSGGAVGEWGRPADVAGDILQQNRELGNVITNGAAQWWFDVGANRYDDKRLMDHIGRLRQAADRAVALDRSPVDEIAVIVDGPSLAYAQVGAPITASLIAAQIPELARIGAPVGWYGLADLATLPPRRMYVFLTALAPSAEARAAADALKRDGRVLVFVGPAGIYRDGQLDEAAMSDFCGIRLALGRDPIAHQVRWASPTGERTYGTGLAVGPVARPADPAAEVLGTLPDGTPGLVLRAHPGWTAAHSAAPTLPAALLRQLAERAGVHLYVREGDVVWATRDVVTVWAGEAGEHTVALPRQATVTDLVTGEVLARGVSQLRLTMAKAETRTLALSD